MRSFSINSPNISLPNRNWRCLVRNKIKRPMERERNAEKMSKQRRDRNILALTGATAVAVLAVNFVITAFNKRRKKKGSPYAWNLSFFFLF